jgi:hypothetical protein
MSHVDDVKNKGNPNNALLKEIKGLRDDNELVVGLLQSLNHYHGNPENEMGWLESLYEVTKCEKKATKKHRSTGLKFAVLVTIAALVGESLSKGESSIFISILKFAKGLVL